MTKNVDALSTTIAMNCKLTNEVIDTKKLLLAKSDDLLKMQQQFYEKEIACKTLEAKVAEQDGKINELEKRIEQMRAELFTDDLINFDQPDVVPGKLIIRH